MAAAAPTPATRDTIPLWLAVAITVLVSVPFGLWLGTWNLTLWVSFITWAEYFALGAKPAAARTIIPAFAYSAILTGVTMFVAARLSVLPSLVTPGDVAVGLALFVGVAFMVYSMKWAKVFQEGSLPFFNGISMLLAVYFTGSFPKVEGIPAEAAPFVAAAWTIVCGVFGVILGIFNVWILFPRQVARQDAAADRAAAA